MVRSHTFRVLSAVVILGASSLAWAADGQTPIPFSSPYATPMTITEPGSYIVTRQLTATGPGPILRIDCNAGGGGAVRRVEVDMNGFRAIQPAGGSDPVIEIVDSAKVCEIVIKNGATWGGSRGVDGRNVLSLTVEEMQIRNVSDTAVDGGDANFVIVRRVEALNDLGIGAGLLGVKASTLGTPPVKTALIVEDSVFYNFDQWGIVAKNMKQVRLLRNNIEFTAKTTGSAIECRPCWTSVIEGNQLTDNSGDTILIQGEPGGTSNPRSTLIRNNTLHFNALSRPGHGIHLTGNAGTGGGASVVGNTIDAHGSGGGTGDAIRVSSFTGAVLRDNVATLTFSGYGVYLAAAAADVAVIRNVITGSSGAGCPGAAVGAFYCNDAGGTLSTGNNLTPAGTF